MSVAGHAAELCRWWLLIALLVAVGGKLLAFGRFRDELATSFPELRGFGPALAIGIVAAEAALAALLLSGGTASRVAMTGVALLFTVMTIVVAIALLQDRIVVCRCFGGTPHPMSVYDLGRNGLLVAAAIVAAVVPPSPGLDPVAQFTLACLAFMLFRVSTSLQDIAAVLRIRA